jgi:hypothetical protein
MTGTIVQAVAINANATSDALGSIAPLFWISQALVVTYVVYRYISASAAAGPTLQIPESDDGDPIDRATDEYLDGEIDLLELERRLEDSMLDDTEDLDADALGDGPDLPAECEMEVPDAAESVGVEDLPEGADVSFESRDDGTVRVEVSADDVEVVETNADTEETEE